MIRSLGAWILDQVFEVIGLIAEAQQRRTIRRRDAARSVDVDPKAHDDG